MLPFLIFDLETTGLSAASGDRIVEVAAVKIASGKVVGRFESLVNPERAIPWYATKIHNITDEMVAGAPSASKVMADFYKFAGESVYVAHNASFDLRFLRDHNERHSLDDVHTHTLCTKLLSRKLFPWAKRHRLDHLAIREGILAELFDRHRAMGDVEILSRVFLKWLDLYPDHVKKAIKDESLVPVA